MVEIIENKDLERRFIEYDSAPFWPSRVRPNLGTRIAIHGITCNLWAWMPDIHTLMIELAPVLPTSAAGVWAGLHDIATKATATVQNIPFHKQVSFSPTNFPMQFDNKWVFFWYNN
ncbi:Hypothetical protein D9617_69g077990 [Elsinoe fawcettii]|nr:Hypothetical protein D9617_69g077990 [Elsinoe fawcettii]